MSDSASTPGNSSKRAMLLTALYIAQEQYGYLNRAAIEGTAARLGVPVSEVYSTASFYTMFRTQPMGQYVIQVCDGLSCHMAGGGERLVDYISQKLGIGVGETTRDGLFTLQTVECLASCGTSPTVKVNDELYEDMTTDKVDRVLDQLAGR
jgi:NADH-quinone oxidoreductase subunit E